MVSLSGSMSFVLHKCFGFNATIEPQSTLKNLGLILSDGVRFCDFMAWPI